MRVRELMLTNYRAFGGEKKFLFADRFAVIVGINGRGKTAILDGLAVVLSRLFRALHLSESHGRTITPSDVHAGVTSAGLNAKLNCAGIPLEFKLSYDVEKKRVSTTRIPEAVRERVVAGYGDPRRSDDQAPLAVYYTTDRAGFRLPKILPAKVPKRESLAYSGALINRMVDYRDLMARFRVWEAEESRTLAALNTALETFLGGFGDLSVTYEPPRLTVRKGDHRLGLEQLSDGERAFLAVVSDLVRRLALANPELENPLTGAGVVLLDEVELHLHPKWQREVCEKLRTTFPNIQFIATTHSPFVIQSLRPGELINLDPEEFGDYADKSIEDITEGVMGVELPQKSERYLQMVQAAEEYFAALRRAKNARAGELESLKERLDALSAPFSDDPAYMAFLRFQRRLELGEET